MGGTKAGSSDSNADAYPPAGKCRAALVAVHNHPSGDPTPSAADVALTVELVQAGALLGIELLDQLVIGLGRWASQKRLGLGFPKG